jgi:peptidoglycan/xylan/chitin deacetylase (PgdA/CDA1 family)
MILTYHGILSGDDERYDFLNHNFISEATFDRQLRYLQRHYRPIALSELIDCYTRRSRPPERSVAITFDDGFENNYSVAFPLLRRHGIPFTVFLTTGLIGGAKGLLWTERVKRAIYLYPGASLRFELLGSDFTCELTSAPARAAAARRVLQMLKRQPVLVRDRAIETIEAVCGTPALRPEEKERYAFLDWEQVREMAASGVEFGSHTVHHPILSTLDEGSLEHELVASKRHMTTELGIPCRTFAYPNGSPADFGAREKQALRQAGYEAAFSLNGRLNGPLPDVFELDRINIGRHLDPVTFQAATTGILAGARRMRQRMFGRRADVPHRNAGIA